MRMAVYGVRAYRRPNLSRAKRVWKPIMNQLPPDDAAIGRGVFLAQAREKLAAAHQLIRHCAEQLTDEQIWWRPRESQNSIGNLLLHVTGNLHERIVSLIGGAPSRRDRLQEFAERERIARDELLRRLAEVVAECERVFGELPPTRLLEPRSYQGLNRRFDIDVLSVILNTLVHVAGHAQEIVFMTRLTLGDVYKFANPAGK